MRREGFRIKGRIAAFALLSAICCTGRAYAAEECSLMQMSVEEKKIVSYIECGSDIQAVDAQVAQYPCENVEVVAPGDISIHTIVLLDNSLSISEDNRGNIKSILRQYVQGLPENETVSLAVFGEELQFLTEKSQNVEEMLQIIDDITFHDQDTYLTDYLYEVLGKIEKDPEYTRFIVISDGVDNRAIGITKEELMSRLEEISRPVHTIGHKYKDNSTELKNMFALSRATGGKEILMEDSESLDQIIESIHDVSHIYSVRMDIPQNMMDGDKKSVLLQVHTAAGDAEVTGEAVMPFALVEEEPEEEVPEPEPAPMPEPEPTPEPEPAPIPEPEPTPEPELAPRPEPSTGIGIEKIAGAATAIAAAVILLIYSKKKKKAIVPQAIPAEEPKEEEVTVLGGRYLLVLRDRSNPDRIFRYPLDSPVVAGRNIDMAQIPIDYNRTVSGRHCEFYIKRNHFYVRDLNSVNHTYLDGKEIKEEQEITSGNIIRLGEVEFSVEIMPI